MKADLGFKGGSLLSRLDKLAPLSNQGLFQGSLVFFGDGLTASGKGGHNNH